MGKGVKNERRLSRDRGREEVLPFRMIDDKAIWLVNGLKLCQ